MDNQYEADLQPDMEMKGDQHYLEPSIHLLNWEFSPTHKYVSCTFKPKEYQNIAWGEMTVRHNQFNVIMWYRNNGRMSDAEVNSNKLSLIHI